MNKHYYFGYGMNTNIKSMSMRCPSAISLGAAQLLHHKFRFAGHADAVPHRNTITHGVLWQITDRCLASLDRFEGFPVYYDRKEVAVIHNGREYQSHVYFMAEDNPLEPPSSYYYEMLTEGYSIHGISQAQLIEALSESGYAIEQGLQY